MTMVRGPVRRLWWSVALLLVSAAPLSAQFRSPAASQPDTVTLERRTWIASKIYASVQAYFGHWEAVPELDFEAAYRDYLAQILEADSRFAFDLATLQFLAQLQNGHTGFSDGWLSEAGGRPVGFTARRVGGVWVVHSSRVGELEPGQVIRRIDGIPAEDFVRERLRYIPVSSEAEGIRKLWSREYLFPSSFDVDLADGRRVRIDRPAQSLATSDGPSYEERSEDGVAYVRIPNFANPEMERTAVAFIEANAGAEALIIDVRGNGGGTTPSQLIDALMDRPYREFTESTSVTYGLFEAYAKIARENPPSAFDDYIRGYLDALDEMGRVQLRMPARLIHPGEPSYTGPVFVLIDGACASACEDFVMPLRISGRATVIGERTSGSTGQPYMHSFGDRMGFRVSTKRVYFPDGSQFEGVGIEPHVALEPGPEDLRAGRDPVLERAREMAAEAARS